MTIHPFHARNDHHRSATTWQMLLESARDEQDVIRLARDFVASFTPHEIELLEPACRPAKLVDSSDVASYGYDLMLHRTDDDSAGAQITQTFAAFFADATERLAELYREAAQKNERESA